MAKTNILKKSRKTYIFSHRGSGGESGINVTPLTVTENGTYTSAEGQAYSPVTVRVEGDVEVEDNKPVSISENGTVVINPTSGKDAMAKVTATVNVTPVLETKTITENGTYTPAAGKDGFSEVTVNVSGGGSGGDSVPLYAWKKGNDADKICYTYTENPSVGDTIIGSDPSEGYSEIFIVENSVSEVGENQITVSSDEPRLYSGAYTRDSTKDLVLQAGEGGGGALYCWKGAGAGTFYTASATPADEAPIYAVTSESGQPSEINEDSFRVKHYSNSVITVQEYTSSEWRDYTSLAGDTEFSRYSEGDIVLSADIEENKAATIDVSQYSTPVEIIPSSGKAGMAKTTVTLSNIPVAQGTKLYGYSEESFGSEYTGRHFFATEDIDTSVTSSGTASLVFADQSMDGMVIAEENVPYTTDAEDGTVRFEGETVDLTVYRRPDLDVIVDSGGLEIENNKSISITQNGTYIINPTTGKDTMAKVTATVSVATASVEGTNLILSSGSVSGYTLNL